MELIDQFLTQYARAFDFYDAAARICAQQLQSLLRNTGIRAIVTQRAKNLERLREKLKKRNASKNYNSVEGIYDDLVDLAGVRIALYFPGDSDDVDRIIRSEMIVVDFKEFPEKLSETSPSSGYRKKFSGYGDIIVFASKQLL
jgi:ppGpp synthetase/RelA/SpoT-type nucleotidyltranferase